MKSLQAQLTLLVISLCTLVGVAIMWVNTNSVEEARFDMDMDFLAAQAHLTADKWDADGGCGADLNSNRFEGISPELYIGLSISLFAYCDGQLVSRSGEAPEPPRLSADIVHHDTDHGEVFYVGRPVNRGIIIASASGPIIPDVTERIFIKLGIPFFVIILLLFPVTWYLVRLVLRPVSQFSPGNRSSDQAATISSAPSELQSIFQAFDRLENEKRSIEQKIRDQLESERRFTANAAHELLTPLAAIKIEIQRRISEARSDHDKEILNGIEERADRASHTVNQLMTLARFDPELDQSQFSKFNLSNAIEEAFAAYGDLLVEKEIDFELISGGSVSFVGIQTGIKILLDNLANNATKYCPQSGSVRANLSSTQGAISIIFENDCRPLPNYFLDHMMDRFVRAPGETATGSGLGMSIVKRVVDLHGGEIEITSPHNNYEKIRIQITLPHPGQLGPEQ